MNRKILLLSCCLGLSLSACAQGGITSTNHSSNAKMTSVPLSSVRWTGGFWGERFNVFSHKSVQSMWETWQSKEGKGFNNFLIAAGEMQGEHHGPPFHDGDMYKWLEAVASVYAITHDPELDAIMDRFIGLVAKAQREDGYIHTPVIIKERNNSPSRPNSPTPNPSPEGRGAAQEASPSGGGLVGAEASPSGGGWWGLLSAEQISSQANLSRLFAQREAFRCAALPALAKNWEHSVFYQLDLDDASRMFREHDIPLPPPLPDSAPLLTRIHDAMFRGDSTTAFGLLREGLTAQIVNCKCHPRLSVYRDQIVWSRSPVRIDIAGGWTDTPPYCLLEGGNVVNLAIELNGQQPLQAYVKPSAEPRITLRSIDLGAAEVVTTFDELRQFNRVGSPFSIPKAALALAGFLPEFCEEEYPSLEAQLKDFGCGLELTLLSAIPAGSGLGTSSILAATVLAAIGDFCSLNWDKNELGRRTLVLEQLLTTGGGWQDQFGGILGGVKLLQTQPGFQQDPLVRWLPTDIYTSPEYRPCHLLYYTGITRTAKQILAEIVRRMFLNHHDQLLLLRQMGRLAQDMYEAIQRQDFQQMGLLVRKNWQQNQQLDSGTNPDGVRRLTDLIDDLCLGYKLPGAGGGGYLYMVAKDPEAAARIRQTLRDHALNANARFVDMALSPTGLQVSRS